MKHETKHKGFVESVLPHLKGKLVEIFTGTYAKNRKYSDFDHQQKEVIRGILKDGDCDLLIIEVADSVGNKNDVFVNGWSVTAMLEPKRGISIVDIYLDEHQKQDK